MAYSRPTQFSHGTVPTAAMLNVWLDDLDAIKAIIDVTAPNLPAMVYEGDEDDAAWSFIHLHRYLRYGDEAELYDPDNRAAHSVSLPEPDIETGVRGVYDLDSIGWLTYGMTYILVGCAWATEDDDPTYA